MHATRKIVILAPTSSSLERVAGVPLALRSVLCAARAGFDRIVVLTSMSDEIHALARDPRVGGAHVVVTDRTRLEATADLTIVAADVLVTASGLRRLLGAPSSRPTLVTVDGRPALARCLGRDLVAASGPMLGIDDAVASFAVLRGTCARDGALDGDVCVGVAGARGIARAEAALCSRLRADSAASDGVLARTIDRRISCAISRWIVRHTRLRPNAVTMIGTAIGIAGAALLARGTYASGVAGTLLFLMAAIVDGCDGEVARLTFRESPFGQKLDVTTDNIVHLAIFVGLAIGAHRRWPDGHVAVLAALLLGGFALDGVLSYYYLVVRTAWRAPVDADAPGRARLRQRVLNGLEALMNRDFAYLLLLLAVVDRLHWFLWGAAIGSYVFAAVFVLFQRAGAAVDDAVAL